MHIMLKRISGFLLLSLTLASTAMAGEVFIPATFRGPGAGGSVWRTEISVSNISQHTVVPVQTRITLHYPDGHSQSVSMPLSNMEVISLPDALHSWFDVEQGGGLVTVSWDDPHARITANARVYNTGGAGGEFGQGVPAVRPETLLSDAFLPGLSGIDGNRTNVIISNPHSSAVIAWVTLYDTAGTARGSYALGVAPRSYTQINDVFHAFNVAPFGAAMVRVTGMDHTVYAGASVVRNDTGDATYIAPAP
jgi:hypothetical protein